METPEKYSLEKFKKLDLRVAKIISAERVEGSDKLLKLEVDLGDEKRQIIAGIGKAYAPEDLINKEMVIIANLEPKMIKGLESRGMLLAADAEGGPVLVVPEKVIMPGTKIC